MVSISHHQVKRQLKLFKAPKILEGSIVRGYQRGRDLGFKTANLNPKSYENDSEFLKENHQCVLLGWTLLEGVVYPSVISLGKNPYFNNLETTIEVHILHKFNEDFYNSRMRLSILGNFRSMENISIPNMAALKELISADCDFAEDWLNKNKLSSVEDLFDIEKNPEV